MAFKKGVSGNPHGRPRKTQCIPDILRKIGAEEVDYGGKQISQIEALMRMVYKRAVEGDNWSVGFIADRTEGKAKEKVDITTNGETINAIERTIVKVARSGDASD